MNLLRQRSCVVRIMGACVMMHAAASRVWAQAPAVLPPAESSYRKWLVAVGVLVVVCSVGFVNAKRSHLK